METTDFEKVKEYSKELFDLITIDEANECIGMDGLIISHPYTNAGIRMGRNGEIINLINDNNARIQFRDDIFNLIDKADDLWEILLMINKPYLLLWFKMISPFLSDEDFAKLFGEIWVISENPNGDLNVSLEESIKFFKSSKKKYLMTKEEYEIYKKLPDKVTVYRGVSKNRNPKGLSYSLLKEKAIWFQQRFADKDNPGFLIEKEVKKQDILAFFSRRGEAEIVVDVLSDIFKKIR